MISISSNALEQMTTYIGELETLTSAPGNLTKKQEQRHAFLLAALSALKAGSSPREIRNWEQDRLLAAAGLRAPQAARTKLPEAVEKEWRSFVRHEDVPMTLRPSEREIRANEAGTQSITTPLGNLGGYFVPQGIHDRAFETMKKYDAIFDPMFSNIVETNTGGAMPFPAWDDVTNSSVQVGETVQSTEVDVANFGNIQLNSYAFRSKIIGVSIELLQDSAFPWGAVIERIFAMRHARGVGAALITGSGVASPNGLLTAVVASGASPVIASGSSTNTGNSDSAVTTVGTADLNTLFGKLDPAYRSGSCWYLNDQTLQYLQGLVSKQGTPIIEFRQGTVGLYGDAPYLLGKPCAICPSMPSMGSGKNPIIFGNPFYFVQRRVPSATYVRAFWQNPTLVQYGMFGLESWMRVDSNLSAPNTNYLPMQFLQSHS